MRGGLHVRRVPGGEGVRRGTTGGQGGWAARDTARQRSAGSGETAERVSVGHDIISDATLPTVPAVRFCRGAVVVPPELALHPHRSG